MRENTSADNSLSFQDSLPGWGPGLPLFREQDVTNESLGSVIAASRLSSPEWTAPVWRWIVVRKAAAKKHLEGAAYHKFPLTSAPVILLCLVDTAAWKSAPQQVQEMIACRRITEEQGREALRQLREYYSASPQVARRTAMAEAFVALRQVVLAAAECGLSAHGVTEFDEPKVKTHFHIPDQFLVAALLPMGYPAETPAAASPRRPSSSFIYEEKFGETLNTIPVKK